MKPRLFIGSSRENLDVANAIQENLEHDAECTVWSQGIFRLSESALTSLVNSLKKFDFAVFVFKPDDVTLMRNTSVSTVRDNVIFEMGLFIGALDRSKVYFVVPKNGDNLHLPTDLLGITAGRYDDKRSDNNLTASLGPFSTQVRANLKNFVYQNLTELAHEPEHIKQIAVERKAGWEYLLASTLILHRLDPIKKKVEAMRNKTEIAKGTSIDALELLKWNGTYIFNIKRFIYLFQHSFDILKKSFGPDGVPGKVVDIVAAVDYVETLSSELLSIEQELYSFYLPEDLKPFKEKLCGVTYDIFISEFVKHSEAVVQAINHYTAHGTKVEMNIKIKMDIPPAINDAMAIIAKHLGIPFNAQTF